MKHGPHKSTSSKPARNNGKRIRQPAPVVDEELAREREASLVRNVMISRLDFLLAQSSVTAACEKFELSHDQWLGVLQSVQLALFPEEFAEPSDLEKKVNGLVPRGGRVGRVSFRSFAKFALSFRDLN